MNKLPDIFDSKGRAKYQAATWKRTDIPVEVITFENKEYKQHKFWSLADAQKKFPHLTLGQGMRGEWKNENGETECEYVLRFEEYKFD